MSTKSPTFWDRLRGKVDQDQVSTAPKGLVIRKLADRQPGETRETRYNELTGEKYLFNPRTQMAENWPLMGILAEDAPQSIIVPMSFVTSGMVEAEPRWMTVEGHRPVHRSGGPPENPWQVTHTFHQIDRMVLHTLEGDISYRVVHQPDKYEDSSEPGKMRVDWFYLMEKEPADG